MRTCGMFPGRGWPARSALVLVALSAALPLQAQKKAATTIYSCVDDRGRRLTSDRPIAECAAREQQILNSDGSVKDVLPPTLTAAERAAVEARERKESAERMALLEATRRDKYLLLRFPNETAHLKTREAALDNVRLAITATEKRLKELATERKPLLDEAEFYKGKKLPSKLRGQLDANDAAVAAQREAAANQQAELDRVNSLYDIELSRLRKLWAGAAPGSLGPIPQPTRPAEAEAPAASR